MSTLQLFVPNKSNASVVSISAEDQHLLDVSCALSVLVDTDNQPLLNEFLTNYFFGFYEGKQQFKPSAYAGSMLEEVEEESFDGACLPGSGDLDPSFDSIQDWLKTIISTFGEDTIVVCCHYC